MSLRVYSCGVLMALSLLAGCGALPPGKAGPGIATEVTLPLVTAWFENTLVQYISTDSSDAAMAQAKDMNFVPLLANALGKGPGAAPTASVLARIYVFPDGSQRNVLPSMPKPTGYANADTAYSPLWQLYAVAWQPGRARRDLRSEDALLDAAERGDVTITATRIVANCPVVYSAQGGLLSGARLGYAPPAK